MDNDSAAGGEIKPHHTHDDLEAMLAELDVVAAEVETQERAEAAAAAAQPQAEPIVEVARLPIEAMVEELESAAPVAPPAPMAATPQAQPVDIHAMLAELADLDEVIPPDDEAAPVKIEAPAVMPPSVLTTAVMPPARVVSGKVRAAEEAQAVYRAAQERVAKLKAELAAAEIEVTKARKKVVAAWSKPVERDETKPVSETLQAARDWKKKHKPKEAMPIEDVRTKRGEKRKKRITNVMADPERHERHKECQTLAKRRHRYRRKHGSEPPHTPEFYPVS